MLLVVLMNVEVVVHAQSKHYDQRLQQMSVLARTNVHSLKRAHSPFQFTNQRSDFNGFRPSPEYRQYLAPPAHFCSPMGGREQDAEYKVLPGTKPLRLTTQCLERTLLPECAPVWWLRSLAR